MVKVNNETVQVGLNCDGSLKLNGNPKLNNGTVLIDWRYKDDSELTAVAFLAKYYQARNNVVDLFIPYVPYANIKFNRNPEEIFCIKYFAAMINSLGFRNVYTIEPNDIVLATVNNIIVADGFFNKCVECIKDIIGTNPTVCYFDGEYPRNNIDGKDFIIVGNTFNSKNVHSLATHLRIHGATGVYVFCPYILDKDVYYIINNISFNPVNKTFTTDIIDSSNLLPYSNLPPHDRLEVFNITYSIMEE